jgi:hypothetical protein
VDHGATRFLATKMREEIWKTAQPTMVARKEGYPMGLPLAEGKVLRNLEHARGNRTPLTFEVIRFDDFVNRARPFLRRAAKSFVVPSSGGMPERVRSAFAAFSPEGGTTNG